MKQVIQNYRTGQLEVAETPVPACNCGQVLVRNVTSLISLGTERSIVDLARKSLMGKARARPDLVKRFVDKARREGFIKVYREALGRLDDPVPLGYSSAGVVIEAGSDIGKFSPGDSVACIGAGYASHAEYVTVPENLCCKLPSTGARTNGDGGPCIDFDEAAFGMLGIIALHGVRSARTAPGETVAVIGLGLLGLLSAQILKAYGCRVLGTDTDAGKLELAKGLGVDHLTAPSQLKSYAERLTQGYGCDAVIITAATKSDEPVNDAVEIARYAGRVVIVGTTDIHPSRNEMWHKEVEIVVSKAGGPGSLDPLYENKGIEYPLGHVRWTQNRNLREFLQLVADGKVAVRPLISHEFAIEQAEEVYENMLSGRGGPYVGVLLRYSQPETDDGPITRIVSMGSTVRAAGRSGQRACVGVIGAGLFGKALLLPALKRVAGIELHSVATSSGANCYHVAKKYGFTHCATDYRAILDNSDIDSVLILTPHSLHARMVIEALEAGKNVFVEKPLAITEEQLAEIAAVRGTSAGGFLMVGYNRRFSPHTAQIRRFMADRGDPAVIEYRANVGFVPGDHWVHAPEQGGGRVIGEICHFVDWMQCVTGSEPVRVYAERISGNNSTAINRDNSCITLKMADGSVGGIVYAACGDRSVGREKIELYFDGKTVISEDFRLTTFHQGGRRRKFKTSGQQMGYEQELRHFFDVVAGRCEASVCDRDLLLSTLTVLKINESLRIAGPVTIEL